MDRYVVYTFLHFYESDYRISRNKQEVLVLGVLFLLVVVYTLSRHHHPVCLIQEGSQGGYQVRWAILP